MSVGSIEAGLYFNADSELSVDDVVDLGNELNPGTSKITVRHRFHTLRQVEGVSSQLAPSSTPSSRPTPGPTQRPTTINSYLESSDNKPVERTYHAGTDDAADRGPD